MKRRECDKCGACVRGFALILLLTSGCTLGTRPLAQHEQAVVVGMAREAAPEHADRVKWRAYERNDWNHAPAWLRDVVILATGHEYRSDNNALRAIVYHEMGHVIQSHREGFWWTGKYLLDSARYEREAWEFADLKMEE